MKTCFGNCFTECVTINLTIFRFSTVLEVSSYNEEHEWRFFGNRVCLDDIDITFFAKYSGSISGMTRH